MTTVSSRIVERTAAAAERHATHASRAGRLARNRRLRTSLLRTLHPRAERRGAVTAAGAAENTCEWNATGSPEAIAHGRGELMAG